MSDEQTNDGTENGPQGAPNGGTPEGQQQGGNGPQGGTQGEQGGKPNEGEPTRKAGESDEDWKARSRTWETRSKEHKARADEAAAERDALKSVLDGLRKHLDPDGNKDDDPADAAKRAVSERDAALAEVRLLRVQTAASTAARKAGADVDALLDSRAFLRRLEQLDPTDSAFADDVKSAVEAAIKERPSLKAQQAAPPASPTGDMTGGGGAGESKGPQSVDDRIAARRKARGVTG